MIRITMKRYNQTVEFELPTDYEHVLVGLWKLGLKRDPEKYTLRDLNAVFHYDTPTEHQLIRLIDSNNTLMLALRSLHEMIAPPHLVAEMLRGKLAEGCYNTANDYYMDVTLDMDALGLVVDFAEIANTRECDINGLKAILCETDERNYLCWTISPELSCVLEYSPEADIEEDIFRMAKSVQIPEE